MSWQLSHSKEKEKAMERIIISKATFEGETEWKIEAEGVRSRTSVLPGSYVRTVGYANSLEEAMAEFPQGEVFK